MQREQSLGTERVDPVDDPGGTRVGGACLLLLLVGQGERAEAEDLVNLGAVVEVARALRGDTGWS